MESAMLTGKQGNLLRNRLKAAIAECRCHCVALEELNSVIDAQHRENWAKMITAWEADKSNPNPYVTTQCCEYYVLHKKYLLIWHTVVATEAEVRSQLANEDKAACARGQLSRHKMTPSNFITLGLTIEETQ